MIPPHNTIRVRDEARKFWLRAGLVFVILILFLAKLFSPSLSLPFPKQKPPIPNQKHLTAEQILLNAYKGLPMGYGMPNKKQIKIQRKKVSDTGGSPVYGEMKYKSVEKMISLFNANESDVFIDLGSGTGKAPIEFALLTNGKAYGIEFMKFRHKIALKAREKMPEELRMKVDFIHGDMFKAKIPRATIFMIDGLMFSNMYPKIVNLMMKYGADEFRVWNIGSMDLPFPKETVVKSEDVQMTATWTTEQMTKMYWIKNN